jgi:YVTN family beta-propeller protein
LAPSYSVLRSTTVGSYPANIAFDQSNGLVYVANEFSDNLSVVRASTLQVASTISTGLQARGLALDPANGRLFVTNDYSSNISVINTSNGSTLITIYTPAYSYTLQDQFDLVSGQLYVLANNNPDLLVFNPNTLGLSKVIPIDPNPGGEQFAISGHVIYFPARGSLAVELIGQSNGTTYAEIPTLSSYGPTTTFLDPLNGFVYVMLGGLLDHPGDKVLVLNPATGAFVSNMTVGLWPNSYAYDSARHLLYVTCQASNEVSVINTETNRVTATISFPAGSKPQGIAVDPSRGHLFVGELGTGRLVELGLVATAGTPAGTVTTGGQALIPLQSTRWVV